MEYTIIFIVAIVALVLGAVGGFLFARMRTVAAETLLSNQQAESERLKAEVAESREQNVQLRAENARLGEQLRQQSEEQKNFKAPELENKTTQNGEATVASWTNAALVLDNAITVRLKFQTEADISGLTVKVNGAEVAIAGTANNYYVDYNGLDAGQLSDVITAEIYQGDTLVSKTLTFSAEYYAAYQVQSSTDANLVALVKAMMKYGDSAAAFENN